MIFMHSFKNYFIFQKGIDIMASLLKKITHKINPKTADIENGEAYVIGSYVKSMQEQAEFLAKKARKIKQSIKKDMEISPEDAKKIAKDIFGGSTSPMADFVALMVWFHNISQSLGMEDTAEKFKKAQEITEKTQQAAKSEAPKATIPQPIVPPKPIGLRGAKIDNNTKPHANETEDIEEAIRITPEDVMIETYNKYFGTKALQPEIRALTTKKHVQIFYATYLDFADDLAKKLNKLFGYIVQLI